MQVEIVVNNAQGEKTLVLMPVENDPEGRVWKGEHDGDVLAVKLNDDSSVKGVIKSNSIESENEEIISQFLDQYLVLLETESSGIEAESGKLNGEEVEEPKPYDPDLIRVETKHFSLRQTFDLMEEGDIDLSPDFQRHFVWREIKKRSRLIESIMLRIPLPVFYLAQSRDGVFQVVDGLQRLTVIKQFLNNEFSLKDLEYLKECEGCYYKPDGNKKTLDQKYVRRITQTQLVMNIIDPQTPTRVKFEIFKRINLGGKPLRPQEIRNCMASRNTRALLASLAKSKEFKEATGNSINPTRMEDQELILRFIAFYFERIAKYENHKYSGSMDVFLDATLEHLNNGNEDVFDIIKSAFMNAMKNANYLFGKYAFRKCLSEHLEPWSRKQLINKSLFTSWSIVLANYDHEDILANNKNGALNEPNAEELDKYDEYYESITYGTNDAKRVASAFKFAKLITSNNIRTPYND